MLFIDRGDIQWQYPNRVGNIEKCRTFYCRLTLPNRDFNETWHLHTCRQHQSTYLHSTDTRNKWMKELNNFYGKNHSKGKKKNEGGDAIQRAPDCPLFVPLETISIICHSQSSTPSVSCPLGDTVVDLNFFFSTESSRDNFFLCCPLLVAVPHSENFSII